MFEKQNYKTDSDMITKAASDGIPVFIYGCGDIGIQLLYYLYEKNIKVNGFVVDEEYYSDAEASVQHGIKVRKLSDIEKIKCNVFIGFANLAEARSKLQHFIPDENIMCISNPSLYLQPYDLSEEFYNEHIAEFEASKELFEDELSKELFDAYLSVKTKKCYEYLLPYGGCQTYFNDELMKLTENEYYVDCGAYDGDSIYNFVKKTKGKYKKIYAIEPDTSNFSALQSNVSARNIDRIEFYKNGVWDKYQELFFEADSGQESSISTEERKNKIIVDKLDDLLNGKKVTFIKMSVQGAEKEALYGATDILQKQEPKLAVNIFMKPDALIEIPKAIKKINPRYKIYLRCEDSFYARVILYATVEEK